MAILFPTLALWLVACGGGAGTSAPAPSTEFAYSINRDGTVSAFALHRPTGSLTSLKGSPLRTGGRDSIGGTIDLFNLFLFVASQGSGDLSVFKIASNGGLELAPGSPIFSGTGARSAAITPDDHLLYVANALEDSISAFSFNSDTGRLTPLSGSPFSIGTGSKPSSLILDPTGTRLYVAASGINKILAFAVAADGTLSSISGSPFTAGQSPSEIRINPLGVFLYVTNSADNNISAFSIDPVTGALTPIKGSPFAAGAGTLGAAIDPEGLFLYVTNSNDNTVSAFTVDPHTGILSTVAGSPFATGTSPADAVVDGLGQFLWVANQASDSISAYSIDRSTGALSPVVGSPFNVGTGSSPFGLVSAKR